MTDVFNAKSDVLGERELDCVSGGGIKGAIEGVCRDDKRPSGKATRPKCFNRFCSNYRG